MRRTHWTAHLTMGAIVGALVGLAYFPMMWAHWRVIALVGREWSGYAYPLAMSLVVGVPLGLVMWARERRSWE